LDSLTTKDLNKHSNINTPRSTKLRVFAQCKCFSSPLGPREVRELEGVFAHNNNNINNNNNNNNSINNNNNNNNQPTLQTQNAFSLAVLIARHGFSTQANNAFRSSAYPVLFMRVPISFPVSDSPPETLADGHLFVLNGVDLYLNPAALVRWKGLGTASFFTPVENSLPRRTERLVFNGRPIGPF
jgi:hypothetical protein